ncbi:hypothetical protein ACFCV9_00445 [Streptomyces sp. NPDC056367]|uniref:hypothetical protein n=1 Tax=unclassified Streptomyces TaxID=2593676 RepID=UPI0035DD3E86
MRDALLRAARADADAVLARAAGEADGLVAAAEAEAAAILERARRRGTADGVAAARIRRTTARQAARELELAAESEAYAELRARVREAVRRAAADRTAQARLRRRAYALLGPGASMESGPEGGLTVAAPGRKVDFTPETLSDRALERFGAEAEALWTP